MLSGFLTDDTNFQNVEGSSDENLHLSAICNAGAAEAFSDFAATIQLLQWYNAFVS